MTRSMKTDTKPSPLPDPARRSFCPPTRNTVLQKIYRFLKNQSYRLLDNFFPLLTKKYLFKMCGGEGDRKNFLSLGDGRNGLRPVVSLGWWLDKDREEEEFIELTNSWNASGYFQSHLLFKRPSLFLIFIFLLIIKKEVYGTNFFWVFFFRRSLLLRSSCSCLQLCQERERNCRKRGR